MQIYGLNQEQIIQENITSDENQEIIKQNEQEEIKDETEEMDKTDNEKNDIQDNINQNTNSKNLINSKSIPNLKAASTTKFTSTIGYFTIRITDNNIQSRVRIYVYLSNTTATKSQTVSLVLVNDNGYSNNHDIKLINTSVKTKLASTNYVILKFGLSYKKPAHKYAKFQCETRVSGYRFNTLDDSEKQTVNNTGHNGSDVTENIRMQVNLGNCGIGLSNNTYDPINAVGTIGLGEGYYSTLNINPNGGNFEGQTTTYAYRTKACDSKVNISNPSRGGYVFLGWSLTKGANCSHARFDAKTKSFTYCGASTTNLNVSSENTCTLTANWRRETTLPAAGRISKDMSCIIIGTCLMMFNKKIRV